MTWRPLISRGVDGDVMVGIRVLGGEKGRGGKLTLASDGGER